ncbi:hypothetical protein BC828DRAFT_40590 [Blastocladiella britannica]|nr:hypothetical protein BC828DRAFT_40590 [Blastocladiella britannica]
MQLTLLSVLAVAVTLVSAQTPPPAPQLWSCAAQDSFNNRRPTLSRASRCARTRPTTLCSATHGSTTRWPTASRPSSRARLPPLPRRHPAVRVARPAAVTRRLGTRRRPPLREARRALRPRRAPLGRQPARSELSRRRRLRLRCNLI